MHEQACTLTLTLPNNLERLNMCNLRFKPVMSCTVTALTTTPQSFYEIIKGMTVQSNGECGEEVKKCVGEVGTGGEKCRVW